MKSNRAFTLVELLVVIAILGLLAAILFPVFSRVRENGRRTSCASNLKQIGLGIMQYAQDNDEIMVPGWHDGNCYTNGGFVYGTNSGNCGGGLTPSGNYKWMDMIFPYVKADQVFNCPSARRNAPKYSYANGTNFGHYAANLAYKGPDNTQDSLTPPFSHYRETAPGTFLRYVPVNTARFGNAAGTVMVVDARAGAALNYAMSWDTPTSTPSTVYDLRGEGEDVNEPAGSTWVNTNGGCCAISARHLNTINVLWADGHVKATKLESIIEGKTIPVTQGASVTNRYVYTSWTVEDD